MILVLVIGLLLVAGGGTAFALSSTPSGLDSPTKPLPLLTGIPKSKADAVAKVWWSRDSLFAKWGAAYGVDPDWLKAIALKESLLGENDRVKQGLVSYDGLSYGLMQVTINTANSVEDDVTPSELNDDEFSIRIAAKYLSQLSDRFDGDQKKTIISYNQGPGNTLKGKPDDSYWFGDNVGTAKENPGWITWYNLVVDNKGLV